MEAGNRVVVIVAEHTRTNPRVGSSILRLATILISDLDELTAGMETLHARLSRGMSGSQPLLLPAYSLTPATARALVAIVCGLVWCAHHR